MSEQEKFYRVVDGYCTFCHGHDEHKPDCMFEKKVIGFDMAKSGSDKAVESFKCSTCGHIWLKGQHGGHSCSDNLVKKIFELEMQMQSNDDAHLQVIQKCKEAIQLIYSHCGEDELVQQAFDPLLQNTLSIY